MPLPLRQHGSEDTQDVQLHLAQGGYGEGERQSIMSYTQDIGYLVAAKESEAITSFTF